MDTLIKQGIKYSYYTPEDCVYPKGTKVHKILENNEDFVLALITYRNSQDVALAVRWHVSDREEKNKRNGETCVGFPNSFGKPIWFVLPDNLLNSIQKYLYKKVQK